jgi:hypothetical protein
MKMYSSFALVLFLTGSISVKTPPDTLWTKIFGGDNNPGGCNIVGDVGRAIEQMDDSGFIISGRTNSYAHGGSDVWLVGTDYNGNEIWSHAFGGEEDEAAYDLKKTSDGGFLIAAVKSDNVWLIRTDELGDTLWTQHYYDSVWCTVQDITEISDGGFVLVGSRDTETMDRDVWLIRTDERGSMLWSRRYGEDRWDEGISVDQTEDGGFIIVGSTDSPSGETHLILLIRTNELGEPIWTQSYMTGSWSEGRAVMQTADGGFIVAGVAELWNGKTEKQSLIPPSLKQYLTENNSKINITKADNISDIQIIFDQLNPYTNEFKGKNKTTYDHYKSIIEQDMIIQERDAGLIKTNELGETLWSLIVGGPGWDDIYSISPTSDDGYIVAGEKNVRKTDSQDFWLIRGDVSGDTLWTTTIGDSVNEIAFDVKQTFEYGYIATGTKYNNEVGMEQMWLVRLGEEITDIELPAAQFPERFVLEQNYPNPFNSTTTIRYSVAKQAKILLKVYDILGQELKVLVNEYHSPGQKSVTWDGTDQYGRFVSSGIYLYQLQTENEVQIRKMMLIK